MERQQDNSLLNLIWTNKFESLGIKYDLESRMKEIRSLINTWTPQKSNSVIGMITIIKGLLISKVTHILLSLPNPKIQTLHEIDTLFKHF